VYVFFPAAVGLCPGTADGACPPVYLALDAPPPIWRVALSYAARSAIPHLFAARTFADVLRVIRRNISVIAMDANKIAPSLTNTLSLY